MEERTISKLKQLVCNEMEELKGKKTLSTSEIDLLYKMTSIVKNLEKIKLMKEGGYSEDGQSRSGTWEADMRGEYGHGTSYARRRDSRGRYARDSYQEDYSRDYSSEYSRDSGKMMQMLDKMMDEATTEREREAIRKCKAELG